MYVGLDVSQKSTAICVVNERGQRQWRGTCPTDPHVLASQLKRHAGADARIGMETGAMTPWLVHGLRQAGLTVDCLDARRVKAALQMRLNKTDQNDAEGLAQVMRTGWYRPVHVKSLDAHRARSLLGARAQLVGMRTRLTNMIRGILKTYGMLPGSGRGLRFDRGRRDHPGRSGSRHGRSSAACDIAACGRADHHVRQSGAASGSRRSNLPLVDERSWHRRLVVARSREHCRGPKKVLAIPSCGSALGFNPPPIPVR